MEGTYSIQYQLYHQFSVHQSESTVQPAACPETEMSRACARATLDRVTIRVAASLLLNHQGLAYKPITRALRLPCTACRSGPCLRFGLHHQVLTLNPCFYICISLSYACASEAGEGGPWEDVVVCASGEAPPHIVPLAPCPRAA